MLAVDPGTVKCGIAVVTREETPEGAGRTRVLHREVAPTERVVARVLPLIADHSVETVLIGDSTNGAVLRRALREALPPALPVEAVNEAFTSQRARQRFHLENPPRGLLLRLLPSGLRTPPRPYDDYVAVLLAEDWFAADAHPEA